MKNDDTRIWRLALPDDWEPDDYWCVSFQIPAGDQYVDALAGVLGLLTLSKTFERDETHTGAATVAKTWKRAIMLAPMVVNETCPVIEPIPIPDAAAAADAAAAIFTQFYQPIITQLNSCASVPGDCAACVDTLYASFAPYGASEAVRGALLRLCNDLNDLTSGERAAYATDCLCLDEFGTLSDDIAANPYDWLNQLSDWLFGWLNDTSDAILNDLATVGGLMTGGGIFGYIQDNGGIPAGGGAGFGSSCPWSHTIDFTLTDDTWSNINGWNTGVWTSGTGWVSQLSVNQYANEDLTVVDIVRDFDGSWTLLYAKMTFSMAGGDWELTDPPYYAYMSANGIGLVDTYSVPDGSALEYDATTLISGMVGMRIQLIAADHNRPYHGDPGGVTILAQLEIHGEGPNPWA